MYLEFQNVFLKFVKFIDETEMEGVLVFQIMPFGMNMGL